MVAGRDIIVQFGLGTAPATFKVRVKRFLDAYLGPEAGPFGGRSTQIQMLNRWLAEPSSPRNALITAPAGRGKTSLVVHWISQLNDEWQVVFIPISIRFGTNRAGVFYQALAARLSEVILQPLLSTPIDAEAFYRDRVTELLDEIPSSGKKCLLVIDGLDEATGWALDASVLPSRAQKDLRVLISARLVAGDHDATGWIQRLGWNASPRDTAVIDVPPLDRGGIADVLQRMGDPLAGLAGDVDILGELLRLTEGDPLLIGVYVRDLRQKPDQVTRLRVEDLRGLEPGFSAYFQNWFDWEEQRWSQAGATVDRNMINGILAMLSCAMGPLLLRDLAYLVEAVHGVTSIVASNSLQPLRRFIIGDGKKIGFALSHPRLGQYLREDYFASSHTIGKTQEGFIRWGREVLSRLNQNSERCEHVPEYLLQFYLQHLIDHGAPLELLLELVDIRWQRAWQAYEGGNRGFAHDVQRIADTLAQPSPGAGQRGASELFSGRVRCALCLSSLNSIGGSSPVDLLGACCREQLITPREALHLFELRRTDRDVVEVLERIAAYLPRELLDDAWEIIGTIANDEVRAKAVLTLLDHCPDDLLDRAFTVVKTIGDVTLRATALKSFSSRPVGHLREAILRESLRVTGEAHDGESKIAALTALAPELPRELLTQALAIARTLNGAYDRVKAMMGLLPHVLEDERPSLVAEALSVARSIKEEDFRIFALELLAPHLPHHLLQQLLEEVTSMRTDYGREMGLAVLAPHLPQDLLSVAITAARNAVDPSLRADLIARLVPFLPDDEREAAIGLALALVADNGHDTWKRIALEELARSLPAHLLGAALAAANTIADDDDRDSALAALFLAGDRVPDASLLSNLGMISREWQRKDVLCGLASRLPTELLGEAWSIAKSFRHWTYGGEAIAAVFPRLEANEFERAVAELLPWLRDLDEFSRGAAIVALAGHFPDHLIPGVLALVNSLGAYRPSCLTALMPRLTRDLLETALAALESMDDTEERDEAFKVLAPHLPRELLIGSGGLVGKYMERWLYDDRPLNSVAPILQHDSLADLVSSVSRIPDEAHRARKLAELVPYLPEDLLIEVSGLASAIAGLSSRSAVLFRLLRHAPDSSREALVGRVISTLGQSDEWSRSNLLADLAPFLSGPSVVDALALVENITNEDLRARSLAAIASKLSRQLLHHAMSIAEEIRDHSARAVAINALSPFLPRNLLEKAWTIANFVGDLPERANALTALAAHLPQERRTSIVSEIVVETLSAGTDADRGRTICSLAGHLAEPAAAQALAVATGIQSLKWRVAALTALALGGPEAGRSSRIANALAAIKESYRYGQDAGNRAIAELAPFLRDEHLKDALAIAMDQPEALAHIAPHLSADLARSAWLAATRLENRNLQGRDSRAHALAVLAPRLPDADRPRTLAEAASLAVNIRNDGLRAGALISLAPHLSGPILDEAYFEVMQALRGLSYEPWRLRLITVLAAHLPCTILPKVLMVARRLSNGAIRAEALASLAPRFPAEESTVLQNEALGTVRSIESTEHRATAAIGIERYLDARFVDDLLGIAQTLPKGSSRARLLAHILPRLPVSERSDGFRMMLDSCSQSPRWVTLECLARTSGVIATDIGESAVSDAIRAIQDIGRWWP